MHIVRTGRHTPDILSYASNDAGFMAYYHKDCGFNEFRTSDTPVIEYCALNDLEYNKRTGKLKRILDKRL